MQTTLITVGTVIYFLIAGVIATGVVRGARGAMPHRTPGWLEIALGYLAGALWPLLLLAVGVYGIVTLFKIGDRQS